MRLTVYTDYSMRVLMYIGVHPGQLCKIEEISKAYNISKNHLMKVAHELGLSGFVDAVRGRGGGLRLARAPEDIRLGDVVLSTEPDFNLVECFSGPSNQCVITPSCKLIPILAEAERAFIQTLNNYTLADLITDPQSLKRWLIPVIQD